MTMSLISGGLKQHDDTPAELSLIGIQTHNLQRPNVMTRQSHIYSFKYFYWNFTQVFFIYCYFIIDYNSTAYVALFNSTDVIICLM